LTQRLDSWLKASGHFLCPKMDLNRTLKRAA